MSHTHTPEEMKPIINRLARAIGHLEHVKHMVEDGRDCTEILIQLSAVKSAINSTGLELLKEHMDTCLEDAVKSGDTEALDSLKVVVERYCK